MAPLTDVSKPQDDPFDLIQGNWPPENESAYHSSEMTADGAALTASEQAQNALDAETKMADEKGQTAEGVASGYSSAVIQLLERARNFSTISAWMLDASGKVRTTKTGISNLVRAGTQDIRDALNSELAGDSPSPSSSDLIAQYRADIAQAASTLTVDLDGIGHSLSGDPGASRTPTYVSVPTAPTAEHHNPAVQVAAYNHGQTPEVTPQQLPEMPRASAPSSPESPSTPSAPSSTLSPHITNPTLSNLVSGSGPSGAPASPSTSAKSPSASSSGTPAAQQQGHQVNEQHQPAKSPVLPRIPSIGRPDLPAAAESIATAVTSAAGHQLPSQTPTSPGSSLPASTGITPGVSGTPPVTPAPAAGLSPIGGLTPPPVVQGSPASQGPPATPSSAAPAPSPQAPAPAPRGPVADLGWIQRNYGLAPSLDLPKPESSVFPALFIAELAESEAHLHRALASLRHQFEAAGWGQPMSVARIRRGLEACTVYATADGLSIHPAGILLPDGVLPLDEVPSRPVALDLHGSLMVTEKLTALIPRTWEVEAVLSTVPGGENSQSSEQYQSLVESGELLECKVSRGRDDVRDDEALRVFARAALGSGGCGELEVESARLRAARWVGVQSQGYLDTLSRWYLADAAESMSRGLWADAVWASEKYMSLNQSRSQAA